MPAIPSFLKSLDQMREVHIKKNEDYSHSSNPLSNFDVSTYMLSMFVNPRDQSFVWPISTKLARLSALLSSNKTPNNESVGDSLIDIANYALLWKCDIEDRASKLDLKPPDWNSEDAAAQIIELGQHLNLDHMQQIITYLQRSFRDAEYNSRPKFTAQTDRLSNSPEDKTKNPAG